MPLSPFRISVAVRCLLAAPALVATLLVPCAPAAAATTTPDPVVAAITKAAAATQITPVQAREYRTTWAASARAARVARSAARRSNVAAVRVYTSNLARAGGLRADRLAPALLSVKATTWVMLHSDDFPSHESELSVPGEDEVVFTYYAGRGVQFQPFESFKRGIGMIDRPDPDVKQAREIADRMLELSQLRGGVRNWEFFFPFGGPARPWTSAISQAKGLLFFERVAEALPGSQREPYEQAAAGMVRSYLRTTNLGGLASREGNGMFYVMYSFNPAQRILNGHLQSLLDVHRYWEATGSVEARLVYDRGLAAVLPILPRFDTGGWSDYQPGQEAELGYHELQATQLVRLGRETGDPTFREYGARFRRYLVEPPVITIPATSWPSIIPAIDGFRDSILVRYSVNKRSRVTLVVVGLDGRDVRRVSTSGGRGAGTISWDGRDDRGRVVPDGSYDTRLTITDVAGNRASDALDGPLVVERDVLAPQLSGVTLRAAGAATLLTATALDEGSAWIDVEVRIGTKLVARRRGPRVGSTLVRVPMPLARVRAGTLVLRDSSGNVLRAPVTPPAVSTTG